MQGVPTMDILSLKPGLTYLQCIRESRAWILASLGKIRYHHPIYPCLDIILFQGWGNRKGEVWVQLLRKRQVLADSREKFYKLAPHELEERTFEIKKHPVVDLLRRGDTLRFMYNAGGGGGHRLEVKNFCVRLNLKKY